MKRVRAHAHGLPRGLHGGTPDTLTEGPLGGFILIRYSSLTRSRALPLLNFRAGIIIRLCPSSAPKRPGIVRKYLADLRNAYDLERAGTQVIVYT